MEYKNFKIKSFDEEKGTFTGYCAYKGNIDKYGDIILDGAFEQAEGKTFPILFMHDPSQPIGLGVVHEDEKGLYAKGQLDIEGNTIARMVYSGLQKKYITEMSIGYTVDKDNINKKGNRLLEKISLLEFSLITRNFAANPLARVSGFKYTGYKNEEGEAMEDIGGTLEQDMMRMKRRHEMLKELHEDLREEHDHLKRRHAKTEEMVKACMKKLSMHDEPDGDEYMFGKSFDFDIEVPEKKGDDTPFF